MQIQSWSIRGRSFHFGLHGMGQEETSARMPSDSLFAALVARLARSEGTQAVEEFCRPFVGHAPPFLLTSTFPLAGDVRFFPPPLSTRRPPDKTDVDAKSFKRVLYVSEQLYRRLLDGAVLADLIGGAKKLQAEKVWLSEDELKRLPAARRTDGAKLWEVEQRPRVTLDRASQASTLFFTGQVTFAEGCGLWFGIRWLNADEKLRSTVHKLLDDLSDAGLGAERNSGLGAARIVEMGMLKLPDPAGKWTNLSRYLPQADEMEILSHKDSAYTLQSVGGWLDSPSRTGQRRKTINILAEGSVFGCLPDAIPGQVADVRPTYKTDADPLGHPVYRSGLALAVGLKGGAA
ncbi:MAG: type III-A CRISPR-associated RAMP protein Csm4 [Anaerolineales bacterium]|nr:type III-A CRISPR-associated RAMP protein Csm4 [Anaerolineales bacterium]